MMEGTHEKAKNLHTYPTSDEGDGIMNIGGWEYLSFIFLMNKSLSEYYDSALFTNYSHMMNDRTGRYCTPHAIAYLLVLVGALNWGLVGIGGYMGVDLNLVNLIFGNWPWLEWLIYILVGLSAGFMLFQRSCSYCHGHDYDRNMNKSNS